MKNKISFKLIFLIFLISFAITCISVYIQISNQYENKIAKFENNLDKVKENLIPMLSQSLWSVDNIAVDIFLNNLINNENIIYAKVLEDDGSIISVGKIKEFNVIKKEFDINKIIDSKMYKIGKLTVIADLSPLLKELKNNTIGILFTEIVKMLLISLSIIFVMKRLLTNPLEKMASYADELSLENLHKPLTIKDTTISNLNELDVVTKSINTMRINLLEQIKESDKQNDIISQQSKLVAMGEMIENIAHQWRQPLSLITTASSGIRLYQDMGILNEKEVNHSTDKIINAANYLSNTIDDFRNFFKPNKEKQYFRLFNTFEKTFTLLNTQFISNNINIIKNIGDIKMYGFENELIQVLINILNNAKDELIKKKEQKLLIFIDVVLNGTDINIYIKDNAGGIKDTVIDKIFEPYFTTKADTTGTGIGLHMSQEIIVKHMKGELKVQNIDFTYEEINYRGAEFKIVIENDKTDNKS